MVSRAVICPARTRHKHLRVIQMPPNRNFRAARRPCTNSKGQIHVYVSATIRRSRRAIRLSAWASLFAAAFALAQPAFAEEAVADAADARSVDTEIVVLGAGQTRQVHKLKAADIAILAPGNSPLRPMEQADRVTGITDRG